MKTLLVTAFALALLLAPLVDNGPPAEPAAPAVQVHPAQQVAPAEPGVSGPTLAEAPEMGESRLESGIPASR